MGPRASNNSSLECSPSNLQQSRSEEGTMPIHISPLDQSDCSNSHTEVVSLPLAAVLQPCTKSSESAASKLRHIKLHEELEHYINTHKEFSNY